MFTCFNGTVVFALAYTSARRYLPVVLTYFTDHAQIKQSQPSNWIDGSIDRWIDGSMDRWIDGSMDRLID